MKIDKDIKAAYVIAICVSIFFYIIYSSSVKSNLDSIFLCIGLCLPFGLPIGVMFKKRLEVNKT